MVARGDDDMLEKFDIEQAADLRQPLGSRNIAFARRGISAVWLLSRKRCGAVRIIVVAVWRCVDAR